MKYAKMVIVLSLISLVSGLALGGLNSLTFEKAQKNILKFKKIPAVARISQIVKSKGDLSPEELESLGETLLANRKILTIDGQEINLFVVMKDEKPYAVAFEQFGQGFGGMVGVMVGFEIESGTLVGIGITTLSETPGLGSRVVEEGFTSQFMGMKKEAILKVRKDGGDVDAISGATISSRAVADAIGQARTFYDTHRDEILIQIN